jgi:hypothetical protein
MVRNLVKNEKKIQKNLVMVVYRENTLSNAEIQNSLNKNLSVIKTSALVPEIKKFHLRNRSIWGILPLPCD